MLTSPMPNFDLRSFILLLLIIVSILELFIELIHLQIQLSIVILGIDAPTYNPSHIFFFSYLLTGMPSVCRQ